MFFRSHSHQLPVIFLVSLLTCGMVLTLATPLAISSHPLVKTEEVKAVSTTPTPTPTPEPLLSQPAIESHPINKPGLASILMYHYIRTGIDPQKDRIGFQLSIPPAQFDQQLSYLEKQGYTTLTMQELISKKMPNHAVALTFDDGYADFYNSAFPLLKQHHLTATAYIVTGFIGKPGYLTWPQIKELQASGIEIAAHTVDHHDLSKQTLQKQQEEIEQSKQVLEQNLGIPITDFCYPSGKYTAQTEQLVKQVGFLSATTTNPGKVSFGDDMFALKRFRITPNLTLSTILK